MKKTIFSLLFATALILAPAFRSMAFAPSGGSWINDAQGWTFINRDGTTPSNTWEVIDGKSYYFDESGHILTDTTTPDGSTVDGSGAKIDSKGRHFVYTGGETGFFPLYPTTIKAESPTLADTGLSAWVGADEKDIVKTLGTSQACIGACHYEPDYYTFEKSPGVIFKIMDFTDREPYCLTACGPFAGFFTCSGTDTITREQLEAALGVKMKIGSAMFEDRHFATFIYNGYEYSIYSCTHEGVFQGDVQVSVLPYRDVNQYRGFYDESGAWIGI